MEALNVKVDRLADEPQALAFRYSYGNATGQVGNVRSPLFLPRSITTIERIAVPSPLQTGLLEDGLNNSFGMFHRPNDYYSHMPPQDSATDVQRQLAGVVQNAKRLEAVELVAARHPR